MARFLWPAEDGWPYPDSDDNNEEVVDLTAEFDHDVVSIHALAGHLFDGLDPLEREVIDSRFGLEGHEVLSMKQLQHNLGVPREELRLALGSGLDKLRTHLS